MTLSVDNVSKVFSTRHGEVNALEPTSLTVNDCEFVSFLGPSGCGKSTLLNITSGLDTATGGRILLDDVEVTKPTFDIGMVFQQYTLFPWLTVKENACFSARLNCNGPKGQVNHDRPRNIFERADRFLELVGLEKFRDSYPAMLSGGMKQRLAIARALANRPKVLLMDEPFAALDSQTREEMQDMITLLSQLEKTTVVFVTHDIEEAIYLSDRVFMFSPRPGRLSDAIDIPFGKKREASLKIDPEFLRIKKYLQNKISADMQPVFDREKLMKMIEDGSQ